MFRASRSRRMRKLRRGGRVAGRIARNERYRRMEFNERNITPSHWEGDVDHVRDPYKRD